MLAMLNTMSHARNMRYDFKKMLAAAHGVSLQRFRAVYKFDIALALTGQSQHTECPVLGCGCRHA